MRIFAAFLTVLFLAMPVRAEDLLYTDAEADCAARFIFMNECSGKDKNLLFWSPDEAFPSLGIGHFIWYPGRAQGPYRESFPGFIDFASDLNVEIPRWIAAIQGNRHAPWADREEFQKDLGSERMKELREFLKRTKREQAHYILARFRRIFPTIVDDLDVADRLTVYKKYDLLMQSRVGAFAMIDYVNFKGEGLRTDAQYDGTHWGLAQVLLEMDLPDNPENALDEFVNAAIRVLERRVERAPRPEVEKKWLPGWKNRVLAYKKIDC